MLQSLDDRWQLGPVQMYFGPFDTHSPSRCRIYAVWGSITQILLLAEILLRIFAVVIGKLFVEYSRETTQLSEV